MNPREFYNKTYTIYNLRHENPYTKSLRKKEIELIKRYAGSPALDFGCGTGFHISILKNAIGLDISNNMLKIAKDKGKPLVLGDENLPFRDGSFNTVASFLTVLNMCNYRKAIAEFFRVLKPNGLVLTSVASVYDNSGMDKKTINVSGNRLHLHLFTKKEIETEFEKLGFETLHFDSIFRCIKPLWGDMKQPGLKEKTSLKFEFLAPKEKGCMYLFVLRKP